jgi:hypothetical protein
MPCSADPGYLEGEAVISAAFSPIPVAMAALVLVSCGGCGTSGLSARSSVTRSAGGASAPATARHNAQDVLFAQMMIPHHRQAIVMARQATRKAASPRVRELAVRIEKAQQPEIEKMTGWLKERGAPMPSPGGTATQRILTVIRYLTYFAPLRRRVECGSEEFAMTRPVQLSRCRSALSGASWTP